jgi:hypothetical protein
MMKSNRTRLVAGVVSAMVLSSPLAMAFVQPLIFTNLTGTLRIVQGVPCGGVVDVSTSIADGRMDITPSLQRGDAIGPALFHLTRLDLFFTPFSVTHECNGIKATAEFREIGVRLARSVRFRAEAIGGREDQQYRFSIPKEQFLIFESVLDNAPVQQPETSYRRPSEDVTGLIDLRRGTAELHIVLSSKLRFRAGCVGNRCVIDEEREGVQTTDVSGIRHVPGTDRDADGVPDLSDNCPRVPNTNQSPVATPVITAPPDVTLTSCQATSIGTARAEDRCNGRPVAIFNNAPVRFTVGPNRVTWSGNDGIDPIVTDEQTVTVTGDSTPPSPSCTAVRAPGGSFRVAGNDNCAGPTTLKLGSFTLGDHEVIQIQETGKPGVRLLGTVGPDQIRHFQVGKGEATVIATDAAGNSARAACR